MPCLYATSGAGTRVVVMGKERVVTGVACWVVAFVKGSRIIVLSTLKQPTTGVCGSTRSHPCQLMRQIVSNGTE
jgi:hypothetical protein